MAQVKIQIDGMSCMHCAGRVQKALDELDGVSVAKVEVGSAEVTFDESKLTRAQIDAAITASGYKVMA